MDTVDRATRSLIMSRVGQKNTGPEIIVRSILHRIGLRYRLHDRALPGSPDLVFRRFGGVIFDHGCYWHSHGCYKSTVPKSRRAFWKDKFAANRKRDRRNIRLLEERGWRSMVVWECELLGKNALPAYEVAERVREWLQGGNALREKDGDPPEITHHA